MGHKSDANMNKNMENTKKNPTQFGVELNGVRIITEKIDLGDLAFNKEKEVMLVFSVEPTHFIDEKNKKVVSIYLE